VFFSCPYYLQLCFIEKELLAENLYLNWQNLKPSHDINWQIVISLYLKIIWI